MRGGEEGERKRNGTRHDSLLPDRFNPREIIQREEYPLDPRWIERESSCGDGSMDSSSNPDEFARNKQREREAALGMHNWPNRGRNRITINLEYDTAVKPIIDDWQR